MNIATKSAAHGQSGSSGARHNLYAITVQYIVYILYKVHGACYSSTTVWCSTIQTPLVHILYVDCALCQIRIKHAR